MGNFVAGIVSNFVERDFTKTPLTDEEINVLMEQIPKDDVIDSLNQEDKKTIMNNYPVNDLVQRLGQSEREKIVKAMSNEKIFNLKGDNIFDYYLTNSKSDLRDCMKGHMNKDGTICTDEKFKMMITTMPDLVMGPLGEKQSQWDTEKTNLERRYNTLDAAYDSLQEQKNTLKSQWDTEKKGLENKNEDWSVKKGEWEEKERQWGVKKGEWEEKERQWDTEKTNLENKNEDWSVKKGEWEGKEKQWNTDKGEWEEKEKQWGKDKEDLKLEKSSLEKRYNTLDAAYDNLEKQNDEWEKKEKQWGTDKGEWEKKEKQWGTDKGEWEKKEKQWGTDKGEWEEKEKQWGTDKEDLKKNLNELKSKMEIHKTIVTHEGKQDFSMTLADCRNYAKARDLNFSHDVNQEKNPHYVGRHRQSHRNPKGREYYITEEGTGRNDEVEESVCKYYAEKNNLEYEEVDHGVSLPTNCILKDNKVSFNTVVGDQNSYADCSPTGKCIKLKKLSDGVSGCSLKSMSPISGIHNIVGVRYLESEFVTNLCDYYGHKKGYKNAFFCVKKWKDYKPDETDTSNFKKDEYEEYSPYLDFIDQVELPEESKKETGSKIWDHTLMPDEKDKDEIKKGLELSNKIRDNIKHISENECRLYAGEDASKYFVRNNKFLPTGCIKKNFITTASSSDYTTELDPDFNKIFYNYNDKQIFREHSRQPFRKQDRTWGERIKWRFHGYRRYVHYYDKESGKFIQTLVKEYEPRYMTIIKK